MPARRIDVDNSETRNIYILTPVGWKHLETDEVVKRCGIPLDTADIKTLKELYLEDEDEDEKKEK